MELNILHFPTLSSKNKEAVLAEPSGICSCYFCVRIHQVSLITTTVDDGQTVLCPHCDVDAVVPGNVPEAVLRRACEYWFTKK